MKIKLWGACDFPNFEAVIIQAKTGVLYSNQTGGYECNHPEVEGNLFVLPEPIGLEKGQYFLNCGFDPNGIEKTHADIHRLNAQLAYIVVEYRSEWNIRVDTDRLAEAQEAWIPIVMTKNARYSKEALIVSNKNVLNGILTWNNSD